MPHTQYFVGVDLHKSVIQICVMDAAGAVIAEERHRVESHAVGLALVGRSRSGFRRASPSKPSASTAGLSTRAGTAATTSSSSMRVV